MMHTPLAILFLLAAQDAKPAPEQLIQSAIAKSKAQDEKGWRFTYREDEVETDIDRKGNREPSTSKTFDVIMLEGEPYRKLILVDGKPLPDKQQRKVDADLEKTREERRKQGHGLFSRSVSLGDLDELLRLFDNKVTGHETALGRPAWRVESQPKPDYKPANKHEEEAMSVRRVTWFDQQEGLELKRLDTFIRATNSFQSGSEVEIDYGPVGDAWLLQAMIIHFDVKIMMIHERGEKHQRYYDYKRFEVESVLKYVP